MTTAPAQRRTHGFTLVELLVSVTVMALVMAGVGMMYIAQNNARLAENLSQTMEGQLRLGMERVTFSLRSAGYGVPKTNISSWIPWVSGLTADPMLTQGSGANPDAISIAYCTSKPIGYLNADAALGATSLTLDTAAAAAIDIATNRRLLYINDSESAYVPSMIGNVVYIDTNPLVSGPQGISRAYGTGSPVCRVDVVTYTVDTTAFKLMQDEHHGAGAQVVVDGISNMQIVADTTGTEPKYQVTLTARTSRRDPLVQDFAQRSMTSTAVVRN